eukprot:TRINITY_DN50995_c0_g1_i1.p1 TRINITY_DN50995_c0_g1~~TRINITY_DN50995_c0_g1_i1.p1  ORF type:complete len:855 (+),score=157.54 TRINITY_DN50995_c0_g1_i1:357-2567(+)
MLHREIPSVVLSFQGLRCLDFSGHPLRRVPPEISRLVSLSRLVLIACLFTELPEELCSLVGLEQLLVSGCPLRRLPAKICNLVRLWDLYFDGNQLEALPEKLPPRIGGIKVSGNLLKSLPESMGLCYEVKALRAYANQLVCLPKSVVLLSNLREMSLQGNHLRELPDGMGNLKYLEYLSLHDNRLEQLPDSITDLRELKWMYLYNNRLRDLPVSLLQSLPRLERLLVEANPFSQACMSELLDEMPDKLRVLGIDAQQAARLPAGQPVPPRVSCGWMLPWGPLYAKLSPASQLKRDEDVEPVSGEVPILGGDVLVVCFAASQAEPEWLGILSHVSSGKVSIEQAEHHIAREPLGQFKDLHRKLHRCPPAEADASHDDCAKAVATAWLCAPDLDGEAKQGETLRDFDVLSLCDTGAQWYTDAAEREQLGLEAKLQELVLRYRRVLMLGVSMGGFGALSLAHLANRVAVFGPQTDLTVSHLRPGFSSQDLESMTVKLRRNVQRALEAGVEIHYHVAAEEHLVHARRLPLPPGSLVVHPIEGRIARLLDRVGLLWPLLVDLIAKEQQAALGSSAVPAAPRSRAPKADQAFAYELTSHDNSHVLLGLWGLGGKLSTCWISGAELVLLCGASPKASDWFCAACSTLNSAKAEKCHKCGSRDEPSCVVAETWRPRPQDQLGKPSQRLAISALDWCLDTFSWLLRPGIRKQLLLLLGLTAALLISRARRSRRRLPRSLLAAANP